MTHEANIGAGQRIFVNRTLNMNQIKLVGFDMDYTLATYDVPVFEAMAYQLMVDKLVDVHGYPAEIRKLAWDPDFIIRGLVLDTELGNVLKVNRYGYVKKAAHGTRFLSLDEQKKIYNTPGIDVGDSRFYTVHTLFSLAESCLFAQLVDFIDANGKPALYRRAFNDIRRCLDEVHQENELKGAIARNPEKFLIRDERIVTALQTLRKFGKKLAMITNSDYEYSVTVMNHCFGPFLDMPWQDLFDIIVVAANKPIFFQQQPRFLRVDRGSGLLSNLKEPIRWGQIYQGGNATTFERDLGLLPSQILYLGDHIHGDVVTLKQAIGWRTGLVVQELKHEIPMLVKHLDTHQQVVAKMREKEELEDQNYELKEKYWNTPRERRPPEFDRTRDDLKARIEKLDESISALIDSEQKDHNRYWSEVMRAGNEESRFATLVERYACIYMACVGDLANYSPFKYFRPRRRFLAHDPDQE